MWWFSRCLFTVKPFLSNEILSLTLIYETDKLQLFWGVASQSPSASRFLRQSEHPGWGRDLENLGFNLA